MEDVCRRAVPGLVADLVALEAHLCRAVEAVVVVSAAEDAAGLLGLVGTLFGEVAELPAVVTLQRDVFLTPVPTRVSLLHLHQKITLAVRILRGSRLIRSRVALDLLSGCKVLVSLQELTTNQNIRIVAGRECGQIIASLLFVTPKVTLFVGTHASLVSISINKHVLTGLLPGILLE